jgi:hypothetical protein
VDGLCRRSDNDLLGVHKGEEPRTILLKKVS